MDSFLIMIDVSPCSRYVVALCDKHALLNNIQNNGKIIKSMVLPGEVPDQNDGNQVVFSNGCNGHHSIFISYDYWDEDYNMMVYSIKIWNPFLFDDEDDADTTDSFITIFQQPLAFNYFALSHDNSMIAISSKEKQNDAEAKLNIYYYDKHNKSVTLK